MARNILNMTLIALGLLAAGCGDGIDDARKDLIKKGAKAQSDDLTAVDPVVETPAEEPEERIDPIIAAKEVPEGVGLDIEVTDTNVAIRNFDQVNRTFAALTGVATTNAAVATDFAELKSQLPTNNNLREVSPAKLSAMAKLGARYCDELTRDAALRARIFGGVNFAAGPSTALADSQGIAQQLLAQLWGTGLDMLPDMNENVQIVATLIDEMTVGKPDTAATTAAVLMGACTAAISAAPVVTF